MLAENFHAPTRKNHVGLVAGPVPVIVVGRRVGLTGRPLVIQM
jgi:hypothetical protein